MVKKSHHEEKADDPFYVWSGQCTRPWAIAFRKGDASADLSGREARFRLATLNSARTLYFILKTPDGWLVSDRGAEPSTNWIISTRRHADLRWSRLDIQQVERAEPIDSPTPKHVEEIGVTDLEPGEGSASSSVMSDEPDEKRLLGQGSVSIGQNATYTRGIIGKILIISMLQSSPHRI